MNDMDRTDAYELTDAEREWFHTPGVRAEFSVDLKKRLKGYLMNHQSNEAGLKSKGAWKPWNGLLLPRWMRSGFASGIISLVLILGLVSGVVYAISFFSGYVPGLGLTIQNDSIRVLSRVETQTMDGIDMKVVSAMANTENTAIVYSLKGIPTGLFEGNAPLTPNNRRCENEVWLELPSGQRYEPQGVSSLGYGEDNDYQKVAFFDPLPSGVNQAAFKMDCIDGTYPNRAPENWSISFTLQDSKDLTTFPVLSASLNQGIEANNTLVVSNLIPVENKFILLGRYVPANDDIFELNLSEVTFLDVNGDHLPYSNPGDLQSYKTEEKGRFAYIVEASTDAFPLTMQVGNISYVCWGDVPLTINLSNHQPDAREYQEDKRLEIGGCQVQLVSISNNGSKIRMKVESEGHTIKNLTVWDKGDTSKPIVIRTSGKAAIIELDSSQFDLNTIIDLEISSVRLEPNGPFSAQIKLQDYK